MRLVYKRTRTELCNVGWMEAEEEDGGVVEVRRNALVMMAAAAPYRVRVTWEWAAGWAACRGRYPASPGRYLGTCWSCLQSADCSLQIWGRAGKLGGVVYGVYGVYGGTLGWAVLGLAGSSLGPSSGPVSTSAPTWIGTAVLTLAVFCQYSPGLSCHGKTTGEKESLNTPGPYLVSGPVRQCA